MILGLILIINIKLLFIFMLFDFLKKYKNENKLFYTRNNNDISYKDAYELINNLSHILNQYFNNETIAIILPNCSEYIDLLFACSKTNNIIIHINNKTAGNEIEHILNHCESTLLFTNFSLSKNINNINLNNTSLKKICFIDKINNDININKILFYDLVNFNIEYDKNINPINIHDTSCIFYTSGSTGKPKAVMLSFDNIYQHTISSLKMIPFSKNDIWGHFSPMYHVGDMWAVFAITAVGASHVFIPTFSVDCFLNTVHKYKVTATKVVPSMLNMVINHHKFNDFDLSALNIVISGGSRINPDTIENFTNKVDCIFISDYGMTESSCHISIGHLTNDIKNLDKKQQYKFMAKAGIPLDSLEVKILDKNNKWANINEYGEVLIKGGNLFKGYFKDPEYTNKMFYNDWFKTGDIGYFDKFGYLNICDRIKNMIISGGENIYCYEIEDILELHENIEEACLVPHKDNILTEIAFAFVKTNKVILKNSIFEHCKKYLSNYKIPIDFIIIDKFPKLHNGKINKNKLKLYLDDYLTINNNNKKCQYNIISTIETFFNLKNIDINKSFFDYGLDSFDITRISIIFKNDLNIDIDSSELYSFKSIKEFINFVNNKSTSNNLIFCSIGENCYPAHWSHKYNTINNVPKKTRFFIKYKTLFDDFSFDFLSLIKLLKNDKNLFNPNNIEFINNKKKRGGIVFNNFSFLRNIHNKDPDFNKICSIYFQKLKNFKSFIKNNNNICLIYYIYDKFFNEEIWNDFQINIDELFDIIDRISGNKKIKFCFVKKNKFNIPIKNNDRLFVYNLTKICDNEKRWERHFDWDKCFLSIQNYFS